MLTTLPKKSHYYLKALLSFLGLFLLASCGAGKVSENAPIKLRLLDEYIIPAEFNYRETRIGGLSGIDFDGENFYAVCDQGSNPRIYKFKIETSAKKIDTVVFTDLIQMNNKNGVLKNQALDMESILFDEAQQQFILTSEGNIDAGKPPMVFRVTSEGKFINEFSLPDYFLPKGKQKPRTNRVFEGLARGENNSYWVTNETPLLQDGPKPKLFRTKSPVRFTQFDQNGKPVFQFAYRLEPVQRLPYLQFSTNGVTDLVEIVPNKFITIERSYAAGRGKKSNDVLLFYVNAEKVTNTLNISTLKGKLKDEVKTAQKELIFNFKQHRKQLKKQQIDNIEGICFGPILPNGNQTLILIADNNFNSFTQQLNQIIWLEIVN